jgi:hypothetical protein
VVPDRRRAHEARLIAASLISDGQTSCRRREASKGRSVATWSPVVNHTEIRPLLSLGATLNDRGRTMKKLLARRTQERGGLLSRTIRAAPDRSRGVDISVDGGNTWKQATLRGANIKNAWARWNFNWTPPAAGPYTLRARATDSAGNIQPTTVPFNSGGYLFGAIVQHPVVAT